MKIFPVKTLEKPMLNGISKQAGKIGAKLKILRGASYSELDKVMVIPGGMSKWEKLYYASSGNFPKSVMERWFEKGSTDKIAKLGDEEIRLGSHLTGDPAYELHSVEKASLNDIDNITEHGEHSIWDRLNEAVDSLIDLLGGN